MIKQAKFNVGDVVIHSRMGYRAVIIDADPIFQASGKYNPRAAKSDFAIKNPWYRLLVDESSQETYVEECLLEPDETHALINNPNVHHYLVQRKGGYQPTSKTH